MASATQVMRPVRENPPVIIKALLLDDSTFDRARIRRMSRKTDFVIDLTEACDIAEMKAAIEREAFDLVLIDYRLPEGDGLDVLAYIQNSAHNSDAATIMITGTGDMNTAVTAMRNGCHDFLTKEEVTAAELGRAMVGAMQAARAHRDLLAQSAHQREIIRQGLTDALLNTQVQGTMAALFEVQLRKALSAIPHLSARHEHSDLDVLLATLNDDDEFIFT